MSTGEDEGAHGPSTSPTGLHGMVRPDPPWVNKVLTLLPLVPETQPVEVESRVRREND